VVGLGATVLAVSGALAAPAFAGLPGASADLTRAPYLTDVTSTSVTVTWAATTQTRGIVRYGRPGQCDTGSVQSTALGSPITVNGVREYQSSVTVGGLTPGTSYCYRVLSGESPPKDLLGSAPTPSFTTLDAAGGSSPVTFAVLGDWGDTTNSGVNDGTLNANQAAIDALIAASGARFAVSTRYRTAYRLAPFSAANIFPAAGLAANAVARSAGTVAAAWPEYAAAHRPSALARSISTSPDGSIRPSAISRSARSTLRFDHWLVRRLGVKRCVNVVASRLRLCPSIHP